MIELLDALVVTLIVTFAAFVAWYIFDEGK